MADKVVKSLIDDLNLRIARLEADLEIVKCRQLITDFRVDGLRALENSLQQQTQLQQLQQQQQQQQGQRGPQDRDEGAAAAAGPPPGSPPPPPYSRQPLPVGVAWPTEGQQRFELNRRRDAVELAVARIRRPPTPPRPRLPEFAPEVPGPRPPTPWPRRNRLRGNLYLATRFAFKGIGYCEALLGTHKKGCGRYKICIYVF